MDPHFLRVFECLGNTQHLRDCSHSCTQPDCIRRWHQTFPQRVFLNGASISVQYFVLPLNNSRYCLLYTFRAICILGILDPGTSLDSTLCTTPHPIFSFHTKFDMHSFLHIIEYFNGDLMNAWHLSDCIQDNSVRQPSHYKYEVIKKPQMAQNALQWIALEVIK